MTDLHFVFPRVSVDDHGVAFGYEVRRIPSDYPWISRLVRGRIAESQQQAVSARAVVDWLERKGLDSRWVFSPLRDIGIDFATIPHDASYFVLSQPKPNKEFPIND